MTQNGIARRLNAIEAALDPAKVDPVQAEREREWEERQRQRAEQRARLLEELAMAMDVPRFIELTSPGATLDGEPIPVEHVRHLWHELNSLMDQYGYGYLRSRRLALHPAVVEALLRHGPPAWLLDGGCADCRLPMPYRLHRPLENFGMASGPLVFTDCPDCGSRDIRSSRGLVTGR